MVRKMENDTQLGDEEKKSKAFDVRPLSLRVSLIAISILMHIYRYFEPY